MKIGGLSALALNNVYIASTYDDKICIHGLVSQANFMVYIHNGQDNVILFPPDENIIASHNEGENSKEEPIIKLNRN